MAGDDDDRQPEGRPSRSRRAAVYVPPIVVALLVGGGLGAVAIWWASRNAVQIAETYLGRVEKMDAHRETSTAVLRADHDGIRAMVAEIADEAQENDEPSGDPDLVPMAGPGITVILDDSAATQGTVLHDQDLLLLVNELWAADAEAIAINDQRLSTTTAIRCTGPTVRVNGVAVGSPFMVEAIGDPKALSAALRLPNGIVDELESVNIEVTVEAADRVVVPAGVRRPARYSTPVTSNEKAEAAG